MSEQTLKKGDFIEVEFTGCIKDGEMFDSNMKEDLEKINPGSVNNKSRARPFIFSLGEGMFLKGIDDFLVGKPIPKGKENNEYSIEIAPEEAFGPRNPSLIHLMPMSVFREKNIRPVAGITFNFDGRVAKILSVSGGRVRVDFNNPLAGKNVVYSLKVLRKLTDINEKAKSLIEFLFRKDMNFKIDEESKKMILEVPNGFAQFVELFKDKFKEILGLNLEIKEAKDEKILNEEKTGNAEKPGKKKQQSL